MLRVIFAVSRCCAYRHRICRQNRIGEHAEVVHLLVMTPVVDVTMERCPIQKYFQLYLLNQQYGI